MKIEINCAPEHMLKNIDWARAMTRDNASAKIVAIVTGSDIDRTYWQKQFDDVKSHLFNVDGSTCIVSLQERIGEKRKEGNFLGTLLAYARIKEQAEARGITCHDHVALIGMLFGRGERISPFTQIKGNRKPSITVTSPQLTGEESLTAIEEALQLTAPLVRILEDRGFKGVLCKWGDETQIPSIDLASLPNEPFLEDYDVIKFISILEITEDLAKQKEWVVYDTRKTMLAQLARNDKNTLIKQLRDLGIQPDDNGHFYAGISLGTVAVNYKVLEIARDVFAREIIRDDVYFDFDPYLLMALTMDDSTEQWKALAAQDKGIDDLEKMVPDFFDKVQEIKRCFRQKHDRDLNVKVFDLGCDISWTDIGQHTAMREKYMLLNEEGIRGQIAAKIEHIPFKRDANGNIIVDSYIHPGAEVRHSVIIHSVITGQGKVDNSVIKNSILRDVNIREAFVVDSVRTDVILQQDSGLYESIGVEFLELDKKMRHGTLLAPGGPVDLRIEENTDLRDKEHTYNVPILGNTISFSEAYDLMTGISVEELWVRRVRATDMIVKTHWEQLKNIIDQSCKVTKSTVNAMHILAENADEDLRGMITRERDKMIETILME